MQHMVIQLQLKFIFIYFYFIIFSFFLVMLYYSTHKRFHLFYCTTSIVIVCNLMAFVCHEMKGLLTYLLTYIKLEITEL